MIKTHVYMSNQTAFDFSLKLTFAGPDTSFESSFEQQQTSLNEGDSKVDVLTISNMGGILDHTTMGELGIYYGDTFVAALEIMLSVGSGIKVYMAWAWRTATEETGAFNTDYKVYSTEVLINGYWYPITVQRVDATPFDDLYVTIGPGIDRTRWMEAAAPTIANRPLNEVYIPGSHDSGTSSITSSSPWAPDAEVWHKISGWATANWSKTQSKPIAQQLTDGIRYFDLRVAPSSSGNGFAFVHNLEGDPVLPALAAVRKFVRKNTKEIVILDFNHFHVYPGYTFDHEALVAKIINILGPVLISPKVGRAVTMSQIYNKGPGRVIVAYAYDAAVNSNPGQLWHRENAPTSAIASPYPDTNDIKVLKQKLASYLANPPPEKFFVLQCILTVAKTDILFLLGYSLEKWAKVTTNPNVATWIEGVWRTDLTNIIMSDFYEESDIVGKVIKLNFQQTE